MFFVIPEMPSKTFVMIYKKLPDHFKSLPPYILTLLFNRYVRDLAHSLQRSKLDAERRLVAQQRDYQVQSQNYELMLFYAMLSIYTIIMNMYTKYSK